MGAALMFVRALCLTCAWRQQRQARPPTRRTPVFDLTLSADGNTLAVGAHREDSSATGVGGNQFDNAAGNSGAVYVFNRAGDTWQQKAYLKASNSGADQEFGLPLALSGDGNTLAVSSLYEDSAAIGVDGDQTNISAVDSGAVYVFVYTNAVWKQQAYVKASNTDAGDWFGAAVALSSNGNVLAIGACREGSAVCRKVVYG